MPSQKLKRISLSIVGMLILATVIWFARGMVAWKGEMEGYFTSHLLFSLAYSVVTAVVLILGLYLVAKILIEIFK
ncbi:MAG: hypothetical protein WBF13_00120 [Candidatus Zixiibacteriota bacterium]